MNEINVSIVNNRPIINVSTSTTAVQRAINAASEAEQSASEANQSAIDSSQSAGDATQSAIEASQSATAANQSAINAGLALSQTEDARDEIVDKIDFTGLVDKDLLQFNSSENKLIKTTTENVLKPKSAFDLSVVTPLHNRYNLLKFWGNPSAPLSGQIALTNTFDNIQNLFNISGNSTAFFDFVRIDGNFIVQTDAAQLLNPNRFSLVIDNSNYIDFFIRRNSIAVRETIDDIQTLTQSISVPNITGITTLEGQLIPFIITFGRGDRNITFLILNGIVSIAPTRPNFNFNLFNQFAFGNNFFDIKITTNRWIAITGQEIL
jgi:hypothetical protein